MKKTSKIILLERILLGIFCLFAATGAVHAADPAPIGWVESFHASHWQLTIDGPGGLREVSPKLSVFDGDVVATRFQQHITLRMEDGTRLSVGPHSRLELSDWTAPVDGGLHARVIRLRAGALQAKVTRVYSQEEPFVVQSKSGVVAVRGTEFTVLTGTTPELEVHVFEGEVDLARSMDALRSKQSKVVVRAGRTSFLARGVNRPATPQVFEVERFKRSVAKRLPSSSTLQVVRGGTNAERAKDVLMGSERRFRQGAGRVPAAQAKPGQSRRTSQ